ncbi:TIGR02221 family CRISPR-associated protein [Thermodesulfobium sp. 4217-1]|uniref:TIGR02221 family CRISPR-associated protein n=1 Tax=Thermodesulfobium sp. 4217-1 TaxID=3120013 RepID=UPI00322147AB
MVGNVLISFLGVGDYKVTKYFMNGDDEKVFSTKYAPIAIANLANIEKIILLVTKESRNKHFEQFKKEANDLCVKVEDRDIPEGLTENERWEIWDKVIDCTESMNQISFDITHSYRLIPFYVFLTIEFLRNIRGIDLGGLYYGLYDKDKEKSPIINLGEVLDILSWINFSGFFVKTGIFSKDARDFVRKIHAGAYRNNSSIKPKILQTIAGNFESISSSLNLAQDININKYTDDLLKNLEKEDDLIKEANYLAKPFEKIFKRIKEEYKFLISDEQATDFVYARGTIRKAHWCLEHGLLTQSILLLREALVNVFIEDKNELTDREKREKISYVCNYLANTTDIKNPFFKSIDKVNNLRNLIAHCGYNKNLLDEKSIESDIRDLIKLIEVAISEENIKEVRNFLNNKSSVEIDLGKLYENVAKVGEIEEYRDKVLEIAGDGKNVTLTGNAPVWMYLYIAHALHGKAKSLRYSSPVIKDFVIFDHNPY